MFKILNFRDKTVKGRMGNLLAHAAEGVQRKIESYIRIKKCKTKPILRLRSGQVFKRKLFEIKRLRRKTGILAGQKQSQNKANLRNDALENEHKKISRTRQVFSPRGPGAMWRATIA